MSDMYGLQCDNCGNACYFDEMLADGREDGTGNGSSFCEPCADNLPTCSLCECLTMDADWIDLSDTGRPWDLEEGGMCRLCYEDKKDTKGVPD